MGYYAELAIELMERAEGRYTVPLDEIAVALGGEIEGAFILAPGPGCPPDDRSLKIRVDPARPKDFYVYSDGGHGWRAVKAHIRSKLSLIEPVVADAAERRAHAMRLWDQTVPGAGTLVERYLRSRGLALPIPPTLRFHGQLKHWLGGGRWPAMVALVTDAADQPLGVHVTWLREDGRGKARVDPPKLSRGPIKGGAIRLGPHGPSILVGEGIETSMSGTILDREHRPAWAAVSERGMRNVLLPPSIRAVTFLADADDQGQSVRAANSAKRRWLAAGVDARCGRRSERRGLQRSTQADNQKGCGTMSKNKVGTEADNVISLKSRKGGKVRKASKANGEIPELSAEAPADAPNIADAPKASDAEQAAAALEAELVRLAALPLIEYDQARKAEAKRLNIRVTVLDDFVQRRRPASATEEDGRQGVAVKLPDAEPWPEAVNGAALLQEIEDAIRRYVILSADQALACALWPIHTHALDYADNSPRLHISSPTPECGKTRLLNTVAAMVARPLVTDNITMAAMFRIIAMARPTLLIDEADSFVRVRGQDNEEVRGLLNASYERGGQVTRVVGEEHEPRQFVVWGAVVLASIREIPATVEGRSVTIHLRRKLPGENTERLPRNRKALTDLGRKIARWVADHAEQLRSADPALPEELGDRQRDNWRPLIAIADAISDEAGTRARTAAVALSREAHEMAPIDHSLTLLADVADIFGREAKATLGSTYLVDELKKLADRDWKKWGRHPDGLTTTALAGLLKPFNIKPYRRKYERKAIEEACKRYVREPNEPAGEEEF